MGAAFPANNRVALLLVSMAMALNDLLTTHKRITGGNEHEPEQHQVSDVDYGPRSESEGDLRQEDQEWALGVIADMDGESRCRDLPRLPTRTRALLREWTIRTSNPPPHQ